MTVRVLHVIGSLETGGAETALARICQATPPMELDHRILVLGRVGPLEARLRSAGIPVLAPRIRLSDSANMHELLATWRPQVIQGWMYHGNLAAMLLKATLSPRAALAWNIRCGLDNPQHYRSSTRALIRLLARLSRIPDRIIYNAATARSGHECDGYSCKRGEVIPNGFDLETFKPDATSRRDLRLELGLADGLRLLGFIGRFHPEKNPALFLGALSRLPPEVHGLMVGRGMNSTNPDLAKLINTYGLSHRVHLLGERQEMPRILAALDLAVSTSWNEGFSNALGEAQACGIPCVATDVGDSAPLIGGLGRLVPPGKEEDMVLALSDLLSLPPEEYRILSERCRQRMQECFTLPFVAQRYSDLYQRLAGRL